HRRRRVWRRCVPPRSHARGSERTRRPGSAPARRCPDCDRRPFPCALHCGVAALWTLELHRCPCRLSGVSVQSSTPVNWKGKAGKGGGGRGTGKGKEGKGRERGEEKGRQGREGREGNAGRWSRGRRSDRPRRSRGSGRHQ